MSHTKGCNDGETSRLHLPYDSYIPIKKWGQRGGRKHRNQKISKEIPNIQNSLSPVVNLSGYIITEPQLQLLSKGLSFSITNDFNLHETIKDIKKFARPADNQNPFSQLYIHQ